MSIWLMFPPARPMLTICTSMARRLFSIRPLIFGLKPVRRHCQTVTKAPRTPSPAVDTALIQSVIEGPAMGYLPWWGQEQMMPLPVLSKTLFDRHSPHVPLHLPSGPAMQCALGGRSAKRPRTGL